MAFGFDVNISMANNRAASFQVSVGFGLWVLGQHQHDSDSPYTHININNHYSQSHQQPNSPRPAGFSFAQFPASKRPLHMAPWPVRWLIKLPQEHCQHAPSPPGCALPQPATQPEVILRQPLQPLRDIASGVGPGGAEQLLQASTAGLVTDQATTRALPSCSSASP